MTYVLSISQELIADLTKKLQGEKDLLQHGEEKNRSLVAQAATLQTRLKVRPHVELATVTHSYCV